MELELTQLFPYHFLPEGCHVMVCLDEAVGKQFGCWGEGVERQIGRLKEGVEKQFGRLKEGVEKPFGCLKEGVEMRVLGKKEEKEEKEDEPETIHDVSDYEMERF